MAGQLTAKAFTVPQVDQSHKSINLDRGVIQLGPKSSMKSRTLSYHIYSLWLFTFSDLKTIAVPQTLFGIATLLSGRSLMTSRRPEPVKILSSIPSTLVWIWLNLLPLDMSNQCDAKSTIEDRMNKPWRPIPAGRLTIKETRSLMFGSYIVAILGSMYLGGFSECVALIFEGWMYNALDGANKSFLTRNALNSAGYMTFAAGSAKVACSHTGMTLRTDSSIWLALLSGVIATTIQFQDLYDREGDAKRGRRTIPLIAGDDLARFTISLPMAAWSWVCPAFWGSKSFAAFVPIALASIIVFRLYRYRSVHDDKKSFLVWNAWLLSLYFLPAL